MAFAEHFRHQIDHNIDKIEPKNKWVLGGALGAAFVGAFFAPPLIGPSLLIALGSRLTMIGIDGYHDMRGGHHS